MLPASVVVAPVAISTRRMRLLYSSVTSAKAPLGSIATLLGTLNMALPPAPSPKPPRPEATTPVAEATSFLPASVVTAPVITSRGGDGGAEGGIM